MGISYKGEYSHVNIHAGVLYLCMLVLTLRKHTENIQKFGKGEWVKGDKYKGSKVTLLPQIIQHILFSKLQSQIKYK